MKLKINILKCGGIFDKDVINDKIIQLEKETTKENFWQNNQAAQSILKDINHLKNEIKLWNDLDEMYSEVCSYIELLNEGENVFKDTELSLNDLNKFIDIVQVKKMLNGPDDNRNAILTIHPGAGGTESQDWASMLFRLYSRWAEHNGFKTKLLDCSSSEQILQLIFQI